MLLNKKTQDLIRVLLNEKSRRLTLRELAKLANVSLGMTARIVNTMESSGLLRKNRGLRVVSYERLLKSWSYTVSVKENKKMKFVGAERPQYLIRKIADLLKEEEYAFTLFSATEIIAPYVAPNAVHLYILEDRKKEISSAFEENGILPAEEGNIVVFLVDKEHLFGMTNIRGVKVVSLPQLYVDLVSYGGRGEEAAQRIYDLWVKKNV